MSRFVLSLLFMLSVPLTARAADCYFVIGYGSGRFSHSYTEKLEDRLLGGRYINGEYIVHSESRPYQLGGGCHMSRYFALEIDYLQGYRHEVVTTMTACPNSFSERACTMRGLLRRRATLEGWEISVLGRYPLSERIFFTGRFGLLSGTARVSLTLPEMLSSVSLSIEERVVIPVIALGLLYQANRDFSLATEAVTFDLKNSRMTKLVARWSF